MTPKRIPPLDITIEEHFVGKKTYRGSGRLNKLKKKIHEHRLLDRVKETLFGPFFHKNSTNNLWGNDPQIIIVES